MTSLIPDSWELPSYLAGDVIPMDRYRDRERETISDDNWEQGQDAKIHQVDFSGTRAHRETQQKRRDLGLGDERQPSTSWSNSSFWDGGSIEPYDPDKHGPMEPAELYSQDSLDTLNHAGFEPHEPGVWHRSVTTDAGGTHTLTYEPGHRRPSDNSRAPWHLSADPEEVGQAFSTLRGAISAADEERERAKKFPKRSGLYLLSMPDHSPGRANAEDWLANNPDESFEHDPREEAHRWMDQHAHEYDEWHPDPNDYTYSDFGDMAGQTFHGDEAQSHVLPGSHYHPDADRDTDLRHDPARSWSRQESDDQMRDHHPDLGQRSEYDQDDNEPDDERDEDPQALADHGFDWESDDPDEEAFHNPIIDGPDHGKYVRHQHDPEGNHIATHHIHWNSNGWNLESGPSDTQDFLTSHTTHPFVSDAIDKYRQNASEALLPRRGYELHRGRTGWITHWSKTTPAPEGSGMDDYEHEISMPEEGGFLGQTFNEDMRHGRFASNGSQSHHSHDLADVVREQDRLGQGMHPGGRLDHRVTPGELASDPTVARLGHSETTNAPWGDGKANRMTWHIRHPEAPRGVNAEANYNWDTGNYDFKYTHDGSQLAPTHNYVPEGAPVTIPGRQPSLPLES